MLRHHMMDSSNLIGWSHQEGSYTLTPIGRSREDKETPAKIVPSNYITGNCGQKGKSDKCMSKEHGTQSERRL